MDNRSEENENVMKLIQGAIDLLNPLAATRERALSKTKLQEALFWIKIDAPQIERQ